MPQSTSIVKLPFSTSLNKRLEQWLASKQPKHLPEGHSPDNKYVRLPSEPQFEPYRAIPLRPSPHQTSGRRLVPWKWRSWQREALVKLNEDDMEELEEALVELNEDDLLHVVQMRSRSSK